MNLLMTCTEEWDTASVSYSLPSSRGGSLTLVFVFFIYPIGASEIDPPGGANPSTTPFFETGLHLNFSR